MLHARAGFEDFFRGKRLAGNAGSHVGDAGDAEYTNAGVARGEDFGNGGHAYQIGAKRAESVDFGGRFVVGTGQARDRRLREG